MINQAAVTHNKDRPSKPLDSLKAGNYKVQWVGVGHDGHRRTGDYAFSVK